MQVTVFGSGYVGLVAAACLAEVGHQVICVDVDTNKVDRLRQGEVPIYEPGLKEIFDKVVEAGTLSFTTEVGSSVRSAQAIYIAVGTPQDEDGSADLQYVLQVAKSIGESMQNYTIIIDKSTVPVGTGDRVEAMIRQELSARHLDVPFDVVSNPEFLKEGTAIHDFKHPERIIIGLNPKRTPTDPNKGHPLNANEATQSGKEGTAIDVSQAEQALRVLYRPFYKHDDQFMVMDRCSAELTKYAANAMLATKISFMNQMANVAERVGADIEQVRKGIGSDSRIGPHFISPGCGYGGSCFGKDVQAIMNTAKELEVDYSILKAVEHTNALQKQKLFKTIHQHFNGRLSGKTIAVWGLSFKPGTDDMRDAPSRVLLENLWEAGVKVQAFDPQAMQEATRIYGQREDFLLSSYALEACEGADALVVLTEWQEFKNADLREIAQKLNEPLIFDGRNIFNTFELKSLGVTYYGIGRGDYSKFL